MLRKLLNRLVPPSRAPEAGTVAFAQDAADQLIARGHRAETEGNLHEACEQYRKAVTAAPGYARARLNLGTGLEAIGDADGAILSYEAALAIDPADAYASYNLGRLFYTRGALARAGELLRSALQHKPAFPEGLVALSNVYDAQGSLDAAAASLEAALVQRPDWTAALLNYVGVLRKLRRLTEAEVRSRLSWTKSALHKVLKTLIGRCGERGVTASHIGDKAILWALTVEESPVRGCRSYLPDSDGAM